MLRLLLDGDLYPHGLKVRHHKGYPNTSGAIIVLPGRYWHRTTDQINEALQRYEWVLLVRVSDEEDEFDCSDLLHDNMRVWVQTPRVGRDYGDARLFGVGFPPHFNELPAEPPKKTLDVFLSGQSTHTRRVEAFQALKETPHQACLIPTEGFTQGLDVEAYAHYMVKAKVAPCPSGAVSVDSFRTFEALESHAIPVADGISPVDGRVDYWRLIFPDCPFPVIEDYNDLSGWIQDLLADWPRNSNRITAWWCRQKRQMSRWLVDDLRGLGAI